MFAIPADELLIDQSTAAQMLGLKPETLATWRAKGIGPCFIRISRRAVRYRRTDILVWLAGRAVAPSVGGEAVP
jgi:hypothetical protein